ncbi:MAG: SGNH/GDSL hydrolase family protein [Planctomycetes bacterium]|nr:SGNH/GDSL hydrolase family protein [Planctomycetota bacterium]
MKVNAPEYIKAQYEAQFDNDLPKVIIWGDSISLGYRQFVIKALKGKAVAVRKSIGTTGKALEYIDMWLAERKWDVIHFNNGLHDLCYRHPDSKLYGNRDKINGTIATTPEEYEKNLEQIVKKLKKSGAKLIWASTTYVPKGEGGRVFGDDLVYNKIAEKIMKKYDITINDLNATSRKIHPNYGGKGDVHYNKDGSKILGDQVVEAILKKLDEK